MSATRIQSAFIPVRTRPPWTRPARWQRLGAGVVVGVAEACLTLAGGCSVYHGGYEFAPRPARVEALGGDGQATGVAVLVSVIGVRRADSESGQPALVDVRLRLTNHSDEQVTLQRQTLELLSADLREFTPYQPYATEPLEVAAGQSAGLTGLFAFPLNEDLGDIDLESLTVSWQVQVGPQRVAMNATLSRVHYRDPHDFYDWPWGPCRHDDHRFDFRRHGH